MYFILEFLADLGLSDLKIIYVDKSRVSTTPKADMMCIGCTLKEEQPLRLLLNLFFVSF